MRAKDVVVLDLVKLSDVTDYFVICTATSERQLQAIAQRVIEDLDSQNVRCVGYEGLGSDRWALLDYVTAVAHIFSEDARKFYDLELLWGDAPRIEWQDEEK